jgi:hypothetical protein
MMAGLGAGDGDGLGRLPILVSEGWGVPRQFAEAAYQLWLLEPCLTNQTAETVVRTAPDDRLAYVIGGFDVGTVLARAIRERYGLPSLRETIALNWGHASKPRTGTRGGAPCAHQTGPEPHEALITLGAAVAAAVQDCVTLATLFDSETPSFVMEEVEWLLAASPTPAWPDPAERMTHVAARHRVLLEAKAEAKVPQPRLRIGTKEYGQNRAAITLAPVNRDEWVWQKARGLLSGKMRRKRLLTPSPADALADTVQTENLISLTEPADPSWAENAKFLLGSVVLESWDKLVPEDRALIERAVKTQYRRAASLPE